MPTPKTKTQGARAPSAGTEEFRRAFHAKAIELVELSLRMTAEAGSGHPTSAASLAHVVTALMYHHMRWDPRDPAHPAADRLVLSEGHACPIVYAAAADLGVMIGREGERRPMTRDDAMQLRAIESPIDGHPNPVLGFPFFPAATGSLGQGLSVAAGLALASRLDALSVRAFCVIGDGESREGQIWEAVDFIVERGLTEVCPIFNANGHGQTGPVSSQQSPQVLADKLTAFGMRPVIFDGHDPDAVLAALARHQDAHEAGAEPVALVARTTKGWGSPSLASQSSGKHGKPAEGAELESALAELREERERLVGEGDGAALLRPEPRFEGAAASGAGRARPRAEPGDLPSLTATLRELGKEDVLEKGELATRKAYGMALLALGRARPDVVVLDGDVSNSTHSETFVEEKDHEDRFFECRIAEQNMASVAVGLASAGKAPFVSTFGKFVTRAYDQIEMGFVGGFPLRFVGSHVGVSLAADGPSQMALPDAAWFASWSRVRRDGKPLLHVLTPSDGWSAYALTLEMAAHDASAYMRTMRPSTPLLYGEGERFPIGGHKVLREGSDLLIAAWGYMVHEALRAEERLREDGVRATVVDLYSIPFDEGALVELARANGGRVLCLEDNYGGALGAAVTEALAGAVQDLAVERMFVRAVPQSGRKPDDVLADLELSTDDVRSAARSLVAGRPGQEG